MGVAEWRLKINQPSLFQFVRKQKRKEIIKRESVGGAVKEQRKRTAPSRPKMLGKTGKAKRRTGTTRDTKGKGKFAEFLDCLFLEDHRCPSLPCLRLGEPLCFPAEGWGPWGLPTGARLRKGERKESPAPFHFLRSPRTFLLFGSQNPAIPAPAWASGPQNLPASALSPLFYSFWLLTGGFTRPSLHRTAAHPACAKSRFSPGLRRKPQESQHLAPDTSSDSF